MLHMHQYKTYYFSRKWARSDGSVLLFLYFYIPHKNRMQTVPVSCLYTFTTHCCEICFVETYSENIKENNMLFQKLIKKSHTYDGYTITLLWYFWPCICTQTCSIYHGIGNGIVNYWLEALRKTKTWKKLQRASCVVRSYEKTSETAIVMPVMIQVIKWKHFPRHWPLCGEFTGDQWIPRTKASDGEFWYFLWSASE